MIQVFGENGTFQATNVEAPHAVISRSKYTCVMLRDMCTTPSGHYISFREKSGLLFFINTRFRHADCMMMMRSIVHSVF